ncbi:binding-protein-dependent transport systems inner membrane component [Methylobacterium sp. 4-46]|uniref:carbohydrate ABC transporter permease n=1 Tax=unclassified Methylobacterium TaxID=2615210 RepID=UPI000152E33D|nr:MULTISPECIES: sugar ABC transporter permease [Methylobacterium]ACA20914.1 binding-protein-dependent transport systems inner membrane component [Methylobacterium sp. 4-46]WFT80067.1 sugar ABC transporter permease [Methylobacterium nodulans]
MRPSLRPLLPYGLLLPSLIFLALFTYWPVAEVLWDATHAVSRRTTRFVGLDNFAALFADPSFRTSLLQTGLYALLTVVPSLVLAVALALALDGGGRLRALLRAAFFLPVMIPLVGAAALFLFLPGTGLIDYHLAKLGLSGANWLGDPDLALLSIAALTVWKNAGYYMLFVLAGLQAIPAELREAALLDGAGPWQRLRFVILPALRPTLAFVLVIALLNVVTQVDHVFVLTRGGPSDATKLFLLYIYEQAVERYDGGRAAAATVVMLAILIALTAASLRRVERRSEEAP